MTYGNRRFNEAFKGSPIIPILSRINLIPRIDTYPFKVHSNIVLPKGFFPVGLPVKILKGLPSLCIYVTFCCFESNKSSIFRYFKAYLKSIIN